MLAPTHSAFGIFLTLIILSFFGIPMGLHWTILLFAVLGSILPDIDHPKSMIGRIFYPVSSFLERRFGHRTITHSLIGWAISTVIFSVLVISSVCILVFVCNLEIGNWNLASRWIAAFSISYFSHLILDMFNRRGSQMLWPDSSRDVIPRDPKYRTESGSRMEIVVFSAVLILMFLAFPVSKYGVSNSIRWLVSTPTANQELSIQNKKDAAELAGLRAKSKSLNAQIQELEGGGDLTELGRKVLMNRNNEIKLQELQSQLAATNAKIEELNLKMKSGKRR